MGVLSGYFKDFEAREKRDGRPARYAWTPDVFDVHRRIGELHRSDQVWRERCDHDQARHDELELDHDREYLMMDEEIQGLKSQIGELTSS
jgi:hypothetical protein